MNKKEKLLLLTDLSPRLPYRTKGRITYDKSNTTFTVEGIDNNILHLSDAEECYVEDFKPYLRPMSSMTTDERYYYRQLQRYSTFYTEITHYDTYESIDWLNKHHFDYRGLIEKGLALRAPEGMYEKAW